MEVKAIACELPSRLGLPLSRLQVPDIRSEVISRGLVAEISGTTIWRWLATDAIRPWAHRSWIFPHDPRTPDALVIAQEPPAGTRIPPGSVVGLRTRTDLQPNGATRRLALGRGPATARYPIIALDPTSHELTVVVRVPPNTNLQVWLQPVPGDHLHVVDSTRRDPTCQPLDRQVSCSVSIGALPNEPSGMWTTHVLKRSSPPANVEITVTFTPP